MPTSPDEAPQEGAEAPQGGTPQGGAPHQGAGAPPREAPRGGAQQEEQRLRLDEQRLRLTEQRLRNALLVTRRELAVQRKQLTVVVIVASVVLALAGLSLLLVPTLAMWSGLWSAGRKVSLGFYVAALATGVGLILLSAIVLAVQTVLSAREDR